jgi:hypothetical protein
MMRGPRGTWIEEIEGYAAGPDERLGSLVDSVGPGYFDALGAPLVDGREFDGRDVASAPPVVVVNRAFARRYWAEGRAVGRRIRMRGAWHEVIGVAPDLTHRNLLEPRSPYLFVAQQQHYEPDMTLLVRSDASPETLVSLLRERVRELRSGLPLFDVTTMREQVDRALLMPRMASASALYFGVLALGMAAIGLYGVVAQYVATSRRAIGVRLAVGAAPGGVVAMVCGRALRLAGWGLAIGLPLAIAASRVVRGAVPGVTDATPSQLLLTAGVLLSAALLASLSPAWRASRIDPMTTLRAD